MAIAQSSEDDRRAYDVLLSAQRYKVLGSGLSQLITDGDATVAIVAKLDFTMRDYIIQRLSLETAYANLKEYLLPLGSYD